MAETNKEYKQALAKDLLDYASLEPKERFNKLKILKNTISTADDLEYKELIVEILEGLSDSAKNQIPKNVKKMTDSDIDKEEKDAELDDLLTDIDSIDINDISLDDLIDDLDDISLDDLIDDI